MAKLSVRRLVAIPFIYILLIFGISMLQFTRGSVFSRVINGMRVSAFTALDEYGETIYAAPVRINYKGLDVLIDDSSSAYSVERETKTETPLTFKNLLIGDSSVSLEFSDGAVVEFSPDSSEKSAGLVMRKISSEGADVVLLPFKSGTLYERQFPRGTAVSYDGAEYMFSSGVIADRKMIEFSSRYPVVAYQPVVAEDRRSAEIFAELPSASAALYAESVEKFASRALEELRDSLSRRYSESAVAAYVAEMARRGRYSAAIASVPEAFVSGGSRTYATNTFFNTLVRTHETMLVKEESDVSYLIRQLNEKSAAVWEIPDLLPLALNRAGDSVLKTLISFARETNADKLSALQAAGVLQMRADAARYCAGEEYIPERLEIDCQNVLIGKCEPVGDFLFVKTETNRVSSMDTLRISRALIDYGETVGDDRWRSIGCALCSSLLTAMNQRGAAPAFLDFTSAARGTADTIDAQGLPPEIKPDESAYLSPDVLYPYIVENPYYPHYERVELGDGSAVLAWTSAASVRAETPSEREIAIYADFFEGETHYMILRGIKPFSRIQLYEMDFRTDPRFETYNSSGYVYNERTRTLYLKMRHKSASEAIRLFYESETQ